MKIIYWFYITGLLGFKVTNVTLHNKYYYTCNHIILCTFNKDKYSAPISLGFLYHYNGIKYIVQKTKVLFIISLIIYHLITNLPRQVCGN